MNTPYVLVADDDHPTRCFLSDAFRQCGAAVAVAGDGSEALALAHSEAFDLLILDCRMPHRGAVEILTALRSDPGARSSSSPAVASSAELDATQQQGLLEAGFHAVLLKPCSLGDLRNMLMLARADQRGLPLLDDALALSTSGTPVAVQALRGLFRNELVQLIHEFDVISADMGALETRLHKLRSSCGFCGAASLSERIQSLQSHLKLGHRGAMLPLAEFQESLRQTIDALDTDCRMSEKP